MMIEASRMPVRERNEKPLELDGWLEGLSYDEVMSNGVRTREISDAQRRYPVIRPLFERLKRDQKKLRSAAKTDRLSIDQADPIIRLLRVVALANHAFGDETMATEWLKSPNPALHNRLPIDMAESDLGAREVEAVLDRFQHGDYA
jgi:putative toxin-antitoxin system antitoxin component (TIGR02293 family)